MSGIEKRRRDLIRAIKDVTRSAMAYQLACDKPADGTGTVRNKTDCDIASRAYRSDVRTLMSLCGHKITMAELEWLLQYYDYDAPDGWREH